MTICEFCSHLQKDGQCELGLHTRRKMACREFAPTVEKFCSDPSDYVGPDQVIQMAIYFGIKGAELKKVSLMGKRENARPG